MTIHETLMQKYPVRRSKEEKRLFRQWALKELRGVGWEANVETTQKGGHENVIVGDPENAAVLFTAHYDTPADQLVPNLMMPRNHLLTILYQAAYIIVLLLLGMLSGAAVGAASGNPRIGSVTMIVVYFVLLFVLGYSRANRHNANDNTSGVAALMQLALALPQEQRKLCAFILFDNEERGRLGSRMYAREHVQVQYMKLTVNLDCVGVGDELLVISKDMARKCSGFGALQNALQGTEGMNVHCFDSRTALFNSDQKSFKCGVGVMACRCVPVVGYVTGRIHTNRDTLCSQRNLDSLTQCFLRWVSDLEQGI